MRITGYIRPHKARSVGRGRYEDLIEKSANLKTLSSPGKVRNKLDA
jgi:hypothetical protein